MEEMYTCPFLYLQSPTICLSVCLSIQPVMEVLRAVPQAVCREHRSTAALGSALGGDRRKGLHPCSSVGTGPDSLMTGRVGLGTGWFPFFLVAHRVAWEQTAAVRVTTRCLQTLSQELSCSWGD